MAILCRALEAAMEVPSKTKDVVYTEAAKNMCSGGSNLQITDNELEVTVIILGGGTENVSYISAGGSDKYCSSEVEFK